MRFLADDDVMGLTHGKYDGVCSFEKSIWMCGLRLRIRDITIGCPVKYLALFYRRVSLIWGYFVYGYLGFVVSFNSSAWRIRFVQVCAYAKSYKITDL